VDVHPTQPWVVSVARATEFTRGATARAVGIKRGTCQTNSGARAPES
jgi:hypothetical protein